MPEHFKNLQSIGLNSNQIKVYLASLELGPTTIIHLSKRTGIIRTTIYDNIRVLKEHGLVTEIIDESGKKLLIPENPEKLIEVLEDKKQKIKDSVPDLLERFNSTKIQPKIQFLHGKQGIIKVLELSIHNNPEKERFIIGDLNALFSWIPAENLARFIHQRVKKAIRNYIIATNSFDEVKKFSQGDPKKHLKELREVRLAPRELRLPFEFYIFHHQVAVFSTANEGYTIIIESPEFSAGLKSLFKFLWGLSTSFDFG